jgi:hypothetical protein
MRVAAGRISSADPPVGNGLFVCAGPTVRARRIAVGPATSTLSDVRVSGSGIAQRAPSGIAALLLHGGSQVTVPGTAVSASDLQVNSISPEQVPGDHVTVEGGTDGDQRS